MRRLVLDTNVVVAGLLWNGPPRTLIDLAIAEQVELYASPALLDELAHTLAYPKLAPRLLRYQTSADALTAHYRALVLLLSPTHTPHVVAADPDDDHVIACALAAQAHAMVTGDAHLLNLATYHSIPIVSPAAAINIVSG